MSRLLRETRTDFRLKQNAFLKSFRRVWTSFSNIFENAGKTEIEQRYYVSNKGHDTIQRQISRSREKTDL